MLNLGERMLEYRAKHKLTQKQLAKLLGENSNTVFKFESGKTKPHKVNEVRVHFKMRELEMNDNV